MHTVEYYGEFGYELSLVIPYAYYLHTQNQLKETKSVKGTKELYYFSPNHVEVDRLRRWWPGPPQNPSIATQHLNYTEWSPPPYKTIFKNNIFSFEKPLVIIHNKYTQEWGRPPTNFIDIATLEKILILLADKYQVVYIRPTKTNNTQFEYINDDSFLYDFEDFVTIKKKFPNVILFQDLLLKEKKYTYNELQLILHANCEKFISVQGGNCFLASYFGGTNIIYAVMGDEITYDVFNGYAKKLAGCDVKHVDTYDNLILQVEKCIL